MKRAFAIFCFQAALILNLVHGADVAKNPFDATTGTVGYSGKSAETPVNQLLTPAGIRVPLPGRRPNALALSPNGKLLVTSGLTNELLALDPVSGKILQIVPFPKGTNDEPHGAVSSLVLGENENPS